MNPSQPEPDESQILLNRLSRHDSQALDDLFSLHREFLHRVIEVRMSSQCASRFDVSDVIQETLLEAANRIDDYLTRRPMPFRLWIRQTALESLLRLRRKHVDAKVRTVEREEAWPDRSSVFLTRQAIDQWVTPSEQAVDAESARRVQEAIAELPETDRELLILRNYEGLSNQETAAALKISGDACRKRYTRALFKLRGVLIRFGFCESEP